jgi:hypothetical protein
VPPITSSRVSGSAPRPRCGWFLRLRLQPRFELLNALPLQACRRRRRRESLSLARASADPRLLLTAPYRVTLTQSTFGRRQFKIGAPGSSRAFASSCRMWPDLTWRSACRFQPESVLVGDVRFYGVRDQEVALQPDSLASRPRRFSFLAETDAEGGTACVRHAHILREWKGRCCYLRRRQSRHGVVQPRGLRHELRKFRIGKRLRRIGYKRPR